jgi:transposase-like protein
VIRSTNQVIKSEWHVYENFRTRSSQFKITATRQQCQNNGWNSKSTTNCMLATNKTSHRIADDIISIIIPPKTLPLGLWNG